MSGSQQPVSVSIRVNEALYKEARQVASAEFRSIPNQIEYWARLGKCAMENPDLPIEFIKEILISKNTDYDVAEPFEFGEE